MRKKITLVIFITFFSLHLAGESPKIGLALSGGGARGLAHIGVLKVFDELGIEIDYLTGTSMGAIIGGLYAVGYSAVEIEDIVLHQFDWNFMQSDTVSRQDYYVGEKRWSSYYNMSFLISDDRSLTLPQGFVSGNHLLNLFFDFFYEYNYVEDFNHLPVPFACVATDLLTGETVVFNSGSLHEAVRASMSIPSIFEPFQHEGRMLIDGGIRMNLPSSLLWDMGADHVIGVQVTSDLRGRERLTNPIAVLDQTINISSADRKAEALADCTLIIEPEMNDLRATDFHRISDIIAAGEKAARAIIPQLTELTGDKKAFSEERDVAKPLPSRIVVNQILVEGNQHISNSKIRDYTRLEIDSPITKDELIAGTKAAYNSNLFSQIYPLIRKTEEGYDLILRVREKPSRRLGFNIRYNDRDDLILGGVAEMRNYIGNNSNFLIGINLGGERELLLDYVKNFGREWGVYFRIFPYLNEHTLYFYNEEMEKIASSNSLEYGSVLGLGAYAFNRFIIETYLFTYRKRLYSDIAETYTDKDFFSSGLGLKFYNETLDDLVFPMSGRQLLMKYSYADENYFSDFTYNKFYGRFRYLLPLIDFSSLLIQFEYGSYFDEEPVEFDPFYIGGFDSFMGMNPYERSAPIVKILTFAGRIEILRNTFLDLQLNLANLGRHDLWDIDSSTLFGGGIKVGYRSIIGPLRGGLGIDRKGDILSYISIGYDFDAFEFSRR